MRDLSLIILGKAVRQMAIGIGEKAVFAFGQQLLLLRIGVGLEQQFVAIA